MPLIRAFGRWLRRQTTDDASDYSRPAGDAPVAAMIRSWVVILIGVLGVVPIALVGGLYEAIRRGDRAKLIPERGRWVVAVAMSVALGSILVFVLTRSA